MVKRIEMNILSSLGSYDVLYPKTKGEVIEGKVPASLVADVAIQAETSKNSNKAKSADYAENCFSAKIAEIAQTANTANLANSLTSQIGFITNLAQNSYGYLNGTSNVILGVSGTLSVGNGGTGTTSLSNLASSLSPYMSTGGVSAKAISYSGNGSSSISISFGSSGVASGNYLIGVFIYPGGASSSVNTSSGAVTPFMIPYFYPETSSRALNNSFGLTGIGGAIRWSTYSCSWSSSSYLVDILNKSNTTYTALGIFGPR